MSDTAAWVQAVGTVIALGLTVWVANDAKNTERRHRRNEYVRLLESVHKTGEWTLRVIQKLGNDLPMSSDNMQRETFVRMYQPTALAAALRALQSIPFHDLSDGPLAEIALDLEHRLASFKRGLDEVLERVTSPVSNHGGLPASASGLLNALSERIAVENAARDLATRAQEIIGTAHTPQEFRKPVSPSNPMSEAKG